MSKLTFREHSNRVFDFLINRIHFETFFLGVGGIAASAFVIKVAMLIYKSQPIFAAILFFMWFIIFALSLMFLLKNFFLPLLIECFDEVGEFVDIFPIVTEKSRLQSLLKFSYSKNGIIFLAIAFLILFCFLKLFEIAVTD